MKIGWVMRKYTKYASARYAVEITKYFAEKGHEIHVFCNEHDEAPAKNIYFHKIPVFSKILKNFYLQEFCFFIFATLIVNLYRIFHRLDLVYSQPGRFFSPDVCGVHICSKAAAETVQFLRKVSIFQRILFFIEQINLFKCKSVIAVSKKIKKELIKYYKIPSYKIQVIYNGLNLDEFKFNRKWRKEIREKLGIPQKSIVVLSVGYGKLKGIDYIVKLSKINPELFFVLIGEKYKSPNLIGIKHTKEIRKFYSAADIFLHPTLYDAFGLVVLEALSTGLPVIITQRAGIVEILPQYEKIYIIKTLDIKEINKILENIIKTKIYRNRIRPNFLKVFDWKIVAQKWIEKFKNI